MNPDVQPIYLGDWKIGSIKPLPRFHFTKTVYDVSLGKYVTSDEDLSGYAGVKFVARHENNINDVDVLNDTTCEIYRDVNIDSGGHCHFEFTSTDFDAFGVGRYDVLIEFEESGGGEKWIGRQTFYFTVSHKIQYGRIKTSR